jgi:hypothetical protein
MSQSLLLKKDKAGNIFTRYAEGVIRSYMPKRVKRLVFVSSILGLIQENKDPDLELVQKLNGILQVAKTPEGFLLPMYIHGYIWKNQAVDAIPFRNSIFPLRTIMGFKLTDEEYTLIGKYFNKAIPDCLRYGSEDLLVSDVTNLLKQVQIVQAA